MKNRLVLIEHQLLYDAEIGLYIETPKTKNGSRQIPMSAKAYQAFRRAIKNRGKAEPIVVDGYSSFLFLDRKGFPKISSSYDMMLRGAVKKYNKTHDIQLPHITLHILRHTFCTQMANKGMNPNTLHILWDTPISA